MTAYYNENDPKAVAWLRELIKEGVIAPGEVDDRSILDIEPRDVAGFEQCHFFAGIGVWSYALRLASWPDDLPVWTGSCPCQPFSAAGKRAGFDDDRHLWPAWYHLIKVCKPAIIFGEQVANKAALAWLDLVQAGLEIEGYAVGAADLCAAGVGAPHIRQRLYFVAESHRERFEGERLRVQPGASRLNHAEAGRSGEVGELAYANGRDAGTEREQRGGKQRQQPQDCGAGRMADSDECASRQGREIDGGRHTRSDAESRTRLGSDGLHSGAGPTNGFWRDPDWLACRDGKWRPIESGSFPLAHGAPARVGRLRGYGNAIVAEAAAEFVRAYQLTA